ncbi:hypothetical protein CGRA01v4_08688 [Colletotrichum graminicola]|nr:hypothetical protein CGRA01v4_08688 [Colletotrichum graminicola]
MSVSSLLQDPDASLAALRFRYTFPPVQQRPTPET